MNKKRALCVGINYPGSQYQLNGCVNDAVAWQHLLTSQGYQVTLLLDTAATKENIVNSIRSLVRLTGWRDRFVFTYSGHGTWVPDQNGDEPDHRDEAICPVDFNRAGMLIDDELYDLWKEKRPGARLATFSDSCYSGSVARAFGPTGIGRPRFLPPEAHLPAQLLPAARAVESVPAAGKPRPSALLISGCSDTEVSYDETSQDPPMGAFTRRAIKVFEPGDTYTQWWKKIRAVLPTDELPQSPQLSGTYTQRHWKAL